MTKTSHDALLPALIYHFRATFPGRLEVDSLTKMLPSVESFQDSHPADRWNECVLAVLRLFCDLTSQDSKLGAPGRAANTLFMLLYYFYRVELAIV